VREKRGARNAASKQAKKKKASVSPGLSAISEEKSPANIDFGRLLPVYTSIYKFSSIYKYIQVLQYIQVILRSRKT
jgi:hypothetical protein